MCVYKFTTRSNALYVFHYYSAQCTFKFQLIVYITCTRFAVYAFTEQRSIVLYFKLIIEMIFLLKSFCIKLSTNFDYIVIRIIIYNHHIIL